MRHRRDGAAAAAALRFAGGGPYGLGARGARAPRLRAESRRRLRTITGRLSQASAATSHRKIVIARSGAPSTSAQEKQSTTAHDEMDCFASLAMTDSGSPRRPVPSMPVPRDIDAAADPHFVVTLHVVEEAGEAGEATGSPDEAAMQPDRHHLRPLLPFRVEHVETVAQIGEELLAGIEALGGGEAHVVGVERIGHDEMVAPLLAHPIGQIVGIGIGIVEKTALLDDEAAGLRA